MSQTVGVLVQSLETLGGGERVAVNLCNALESIFDIRLIQFYENKSVYPVSPTIQTYYVDNTMGKLRHKFFSYASKLRSLIKDLELDVLIVVGKFSWPIIAMLSTLGLAVKVVFWEQGTLEAAQYVRNTLKKKLFGSFQQKCINYRSDVIVTLTDKERVNYGRKFSETKDKVVSIYNFIDTKQPLPEYAIDSREIISVGRIDYAKGYEYLIDVASRVMPHHPDWKWHIYGTGNRKYMASLQQKIDDLGLSKQVILKGSHNHILDIYSQYSFLVFTSRFEGFGLVLLEAMLKGLPLVSFDIYSGPSDMIHNGQNGYLVAPFHIDAMSSYVEDLMNNSGLRMNMHNRAHDHIVEFSEEAIIDKWVNLINSLSSR